MIVASEIELRAGARLLLEGASFQVSGGDRIGLVGRNGAGKTTLAKVLAGEAQPAAGSVRRSGTVGYLPQDPRTGNMDMLAIDRVLSARGLDQLRAELRAAEAEMADPDSAAAADAIRRYGRLEERLAVLGGYAAESQAASITASLGLPDRVLHQPLHTLSGGQRRRVELARILFSGSETMLLDEPTNHLDADSVAWLRDHLKSYRGGLVVISHDVALLADVVNKVFYLDAQRACLDTYNLGWRAYLQQRETDERRRRRERVNAGRQAGALMAQADKMRAKATKARAAQNMQHRAERMLAGVRPSAPRTGGRVKYRAAVIDAEHGGREPGGGEGPDRARLAVFLDGDPRDPGAGQHLAQQGKPLGEPGADNDPVRASPHAAGAGQVTRKHGAQLWQPPGIAVAKRLAGRGGQRLARGRQPPGPRERGQVGRPWPQVVPDPPDRGRRLRGGGCRRGRGGGGDPRARALLGGQPALRDELAVGLGDRVAGDPQVGGQRPGRWQPGTRRQPPRLHRLAQRGLQPGTDPVPVQFQVQVDPGNGPCFFHENGSYPRSASRLSSIASAPRNGEATEEEQGK